MFSTVTNKFNKFGVCISGSITRVEDAVRYSKIAERKGFESCWITEEFHYREPFSTTAAIAMTTKKIRLGMGVVNPFVRHPVNIAMGIATIDEISNGRAVLGIGAGSKMFERVYNIKKREEPISAIRDCVAIVRELLAGKTCKHQGKVFRLDHEGVKLSYKPTRGYVPIYLGGRNPRMLQLSGEIADGTLLSFLSTPAYIKYAIKHIKEGAEKAGKRTSQVNVAVYLLTSISKDSKVARERVKLFLAYLLSFIDPAFEYTDITKEEITPLRESLLRGKSPLEHVTNKLIDTFAIAGNVEECCEKFEEYATTGLTEPVFLLLGPDSKKAIELIYDEVIPQFS